MYLTRADRTPFDRRAADVQSLCVKIESTSPSSPSARSQPPAAALLLACSGDVAPAITDATAGRLSNHEKASSSIVHLRDSENSISRSTTARFRCVSSLSPLPESRRLPAGAAWPRRYLPVSRPLASGK